MVLAAKAALEHGAGRVLILDLDAHCGGGTASLIANDERIWQLDVSVDRFDRYHASSHVRLELVTEAADYLRTIRRGLQDFVRDGVRFDLCLYNAGMDPFSGCFIGGLEGVSQEVLADREALVFDWCRATRTPVAFVIAGGYVSDSLSVTTLVHLHRLTLSASVGA